MFNLRLFLRARLRREGHGRHRRRGGVGKHSTVSSSGDTNRSFLVLRHSWLARSLSPVHWPAFVGIPKTTWCTKYGVTLVD